MADSALFRDAGRDAMPSGGIRQHDIILLADHRAILVTDVFGEPGLIVTRNEKDKFVLPDCGCTREFQFSSVQNHISEESATFWVHILVTRTVVPDMCCANMHIDGIVGRTWLLRNLPKACLLTVGRKCITKQKSKNRNERPYRSPH